MPPPEAATARAAFLRDVLAGLSARPRSLPSKYFYDAEGSALFDRITELEAYYPTRTELAIMEAHADDMAASLGSRVALIEFGSGSSVKSRRLLDALDRPSAYVPVDISEEHLLATAERLRAAYPDLPVLPVAQDYTEPLVLPPLPPHTRRALYFPGSTIGNFTREEADAFLRRAARLAGPGGRLLIGFDLIKDRTMLERAYNDEEGVTAAFNRNLLHRINRELDGTFEPEAFAHRAVWNPEEARIDMYLVSERDQEASVANRRFHFEAGEPIHTEFSHKYTVEGFTATAQHAGFEPLAQWTDPQDLFCVMVFEVPST